MRTLAVRWSFLLALAAAAAVVPSLSWAQSAEVGVNIGDSPDPVRAGNNLTYTITVVNNGPDPAVTVALADTLPAGVTFQSLSSPGGWSCTTPAVGATGTISCSIASLGVGVGVFTLTARPGSATANGTVISNTATLSSVTPDPISGNESATATTTVTNVTPIHDIQGPGASSPIVGSVVTTRGIVTGVRADGFFLQEPDATVDADPATSEGIFVFTSSAPPAAAAFSSLVEVTGTVAEAVPGSDPQQPPSTQLVSPATVQLAAPGQPLPTAVTLTPSFPDPAGPFDQLERVEHMRVSAASITVSGPSLGSIVESAATGTSDGRFYGVLTGVARPFREAGIQAPDAPPSGSIPPIPRWDSNPERIGVDSAAISGQPALTVRSRDVVGPVVGPLDYAARTYWIHPDGTNTLVVTAGTLTTTVSAATGNEITVASVNMRRFYDQVDDPYSEPVLTAAAYDRRLAKASVAIRTHLRAPDIVGVQEVETLGVLSGLAARILADGGPDYDAYLIEGGDSAGLDLGVLIKVDPVAGGVPRVSGASVTQVGIDATWTDPATDEPAFLFDRPPLVLEATVNRAASAGFPIVVMVTDLARQAGIDNDTDTAGLTTVGDRVRRQRQAQAEFVATYVQGRLTANPAEPLVVIGGFDAFEVNDGYVDVMNVVAGTPPPDAETVVPGDGVDLLDPNLVNLAGTPPAAERYSAVVAGTARSVDHALVSPGLVAATAARRIEHARIGADYPETELANTTALRFSDRDPVVAYFATPVFDAADLSLTMVAVPEPVPAGQQVTYTITATNSGPDAAAAVSLSDTLPAGTTFVSLSSPGGWSCTTPAVGAGGLVSCTIASWSSGNAVFTLTVAVSGSAVGGTLVTNTATIASATLDLAPANNTGTATSTVDGAPTITSIADQTIVEDTSTAALPFTIGDVGTPAASLTLAAASSNPALVPNSGIVFGGSGANRTVTITPLPDQRGQTTITITVSDGVASSSTAFGVTVTAPAPLTYFLGEGATGSFFTEDLLIANPNASDAPATVTFFRENGPNVTQARVIPARSRVTVRVDDVAGLEATAVSVQVSSDAGLPLAVERTQFWDDASYGGHTESAQTGPATRWYFAEGSQGFFDTFVLLANPHATAVDVTLTFLREADTPVTSTVQVAPLSRRTIHAGSVAGLTHRSFGIVVDAAQPIVAERAMYFGSTATRLWTGGAATAGATAPSSTWYFAEGATGTFFDTFILLMNPDTVDAQVTLRYLLDTGATIDVPKVVPASGRLTVNIETESDPRLRGAVMSVQVTSDRPIVAERSVYWPTAESTLPWGESHSSQGVVAAAPRWALAEGRAGGALNFRTYILLGNPGVQPAEATVQFLLDSGAPIVRTYVVAAGSRLTIDAASEVPALQDRSFGTVVTTTGDVPIVVERSMYWDGAGLTWSGGSNASATRLPE
jgi:uncharacterized repeat protein (TIGR01451 family)